MQISNKLLGKRIKKKYAYSLLSLSLLCLVLLTSVDISPAQQDKSTSDSTTNSSQTSNTKNNKQSDSTTPPLQITYPTIQSISPQKIVLNKTQKWLLGEEDTVKDTVTVLVTGENLPNRAELKGENLPNNKNGSEKKKEEKQEFKTTIKIGQGLQSATADASEATGDRKGIYATFKDEELQKLNSGKHPVIVEVGGKATSVDRQAVSNGELTVEVVRPLSWVTRLIFLLIAAVVTFLLMLFIHLLHRVVIKAKDVTESQQAGDTVNTTNTTVTTLNPLEWTILDCQTNTFSLARAQFVWWLTIIVLGYLFLFITRGVIQNKWEFVTLSGFGYTFLISLGTLVAAQATTSIHGSKGAGEVNPGWSDLIVHGGVLALERVQQLVWNIIVGIAFIWILFTTAATASSLPTIPVELLALMGISASGYISGKAVRKPGPIISQVKLPKPEAEATAKYADKIATDAQAKAKATDAEATRKATELRNQATELRNHADAVKESIEIAGSHFSLGGKIDPNEQDNTQIKDAGVIVQLSYIDGGKTKQVEIPKDDIVTVKLDPTAPMEFCRRLKVNLKPEQMPNDIAWITQFQTSYQAHEAKITVINADGQRAVCDGTKAAPKSSSPES